MALPPARPLSHMLAPPVATHYPCTPHPCTPHPTPRPGLPRTPHPAPRPPPPPPAQVRAANRSATAYGEEMRVRLGQDVIPKLQDWWGGAVRRTLNTIEPQVRGGGGSVGFGGVLTTPGASHSSMRVYVRQLLASTFPPSLSTRLPPPIAPALPRSSHPLYPTLSPAPGPLPPGCGPGRPAQRLAAEHRHHRTVDHQRTRSGGGCGGSRGGGSSQKDGGAGPAGTRRGAAGCLISRWQREDGCGSGDGAGCGGWRGSGRGRGWARGGRW